MRSRRHSSCRIISSDGSFENLIRGRGDAVKSELSLPESYSWSEVEYLRAKHRQQTPRPGKSAPGSPTARAKGDAALAHQLSGPKGDAALAHPRLTLPPGTLLPNRPRNQGPSINDALAAPTTPPRFQRLLHAPNCSASATMSLLFHRR